MPCKDTTAIVEIRLGLQDDFLDFDFSKLTCGKTIGGTGFQTLCQGKSPEEILALDFDAVVEKLTLQDEEEEFLLFLEWEALVSALEQYLGNAHAIDNERYQMASIEQDENGVTLRQLVRPLKEMPKIES